MNSFKHIVVSLVLCAVYFTGHTQDTASLTPTILSFPDRVFAAINGKVSAVERKLDQQTEKYLARLQRQEARLQQRLYRQDSSLAKELFGGIHDAYASLKNTTHIGNTNSAVYSGHLDSLSTALRFLQAHQGRALAAAPQLEGVLQQLQGLQSTFNQTDRIKKYLEQRQLLLRGQLERLSMMKELRKFQKQVYYYQEQVKQYRQLWEDPNKLEAKLMELVLQVPRFRDFFARNSQLGQLFALPGSNGATAVSLQGLQTRAMLEQTLRERFGAGAAVTQLLQQQVQGAQAQLNSLQSGVGSLESGHIGNSSSEIQQPNFKPNSQKSKSFLKRLEVGTNVQTQKARWQFPVTSDLGLSLGYKLSDKSSIGVGGSYKLGLGTGWQNIDITHQGVGLRSYVAYQLRGSLFLSGGYERNYHSEIRAFAQLKDRSAWQESGLIGLTKKYKVSKKLKGNMQVLWDFLSYRQVPRTQAVLFRIGYSLK